MSEEHPLERLVELGDAKLAQGEFDRAIHYYNLALKQKLDAPAINLKLAEAYRLKAEKGGKVYYTLGMEPLRRILRSDPRNEAAHDKLMVLSFKAGTLDELTREYGEKAKTGPGGEFYTAFIKRAEALLLMESDVPPQLPGYTPNGLIKYFFDLFILPGGAITIAASNFGPRARPFFILGLTMFLFYCAYRGILYMMMKKR
ncbi:MAG TPA: hypothetical protein DCZ92_04020 [Elusimicrobia bacterium]|nr:hypothetical protein [Elusimicrobiota bacterium]